MNSHSPLAVSCTQDGVHFTASLSVFPTFPSPWICISNKLSNDADAAHLEHLENHWFGQWEGWADPLQIRVEINLIYTERHTLPGGIGSEEGIVGSWKPVVPSGEKPLGATSWAGDDRCWRAGRHGSQRRLSDCRTLPSSHSNRESRL